MSVLEITLTFQNLLIPRLSSITTQRILSVASIKSEIDQMFANDFR